MRLQTDSPDGADLVMVREKLFHHFNLQSLKLVKYTRLTLPHQGYLFVEKSQSPFCAP
jgi:hypothetical protein